MQHKPLDRIVEGAYTRPTELHIIILILVVPVASIHQTIPCSPHWPVLEQSCRQLSPGPGRHPSGGCELVVLVTVLLAPFIASTSLYVHWQTIETEMRHWLHHNKNGRSSGLERQPDASYALGSVHDVP